MTTTLDNTYDTTSDVTPTRPTHRPPVTHSVSSQSASTGYRLGISRSYGYGESRPELRPVILAE